MNDKNKIDEKTIIDSNKNESDWINYKMYVVECLKDLSENVHRLEKSFNDLQLETISNVYKIKENIQIQLKEVSDAALSLQIRVGIVCSILTLVFSIIVNFLLKYLSK